MNHQPRKPLVLHARPGAGIGIPLASMNNCSSGRNCISLRVMECKVGLRSSYGHGLDPMPSTTSIPIALSAIILFTVRLVSS